MRWGISFALLLLAVPAGADVNFQTGNDLFDADRGTTVTQTSAIGGSLPASSRSSLTGASRA